MKVLFSSLLVLLLWAQDASAQAVTRYVRYTFEGRTSYGELVGQTAHELEGDLFASPRRTGRTMPLASVRLLAPVQPKKVIAVGLNYQSHLGNRQPAAYPGLFAKYPTSIIATEENIVRPPDSKNLHFEGEMVLVIGRTAKNVARDRALDYVFGVTAGNDISERDWQAADLQWFRAKASDTFGPLGPVIARGLDPDDLLLITRVNGQVKQQERTSDLIFDSAEIVSYVSRYVTLEPGDVIYTGTPQTTSAIVPGDVVEIEVEGVGVLRNRVVDGSMANRR